MYNNLPNILYLADFPPSNLNGGSILFSRLLGDYPINKILIITGSTYVKLSPTEGRIGCLHIIFPTTNSTGPWGIGRIKILFNYILLPFLSLIATYLLIKKKSEIIITVAHGYFLLVATFISLFSNKPLVLFVHDDWVQLQSGLLSLLKSIYTIIFFFVLKRASHIYAISPYMQNHLRIRYNIGSELQLPASHPLNFNINRCFYPEKLCIVYAGNIEDTMLDALGTLIKLLRDDTLKDKYGLKDLRLDVYTSITALEFLIKRFGPLNSQIEIRHWLNQEALRRKLLNADILFLPFSFRKEQFKIVGTSMPTKIADYLACGRPILVFAPVYSNLAQYAKAYRFAQIVEEATPEALAKGIYKIIGSENYRQELQNNALKTFELNHNIVKQRESFKNTISFLTEQRRRRRRR